MMKIDKILMFCVCLMAPALSNAEHDNMTGKAAIGGGVGGAAGGAIGAEIGGREGAIIGSAAGAALGTAVTTDGSRRPAPSHDYDGYYSAPRGGHPYYRHCPPGQAKKGRC
ncbi:MAG: hypothetical protein L0Y39_01435 [Methylococcaceae bacterium]|nr:hypothetical protein [Methylococcaceae bacterium]MCI0666974.1 hypothetical protein [Methylococcaceae bacterium]